MTGRDRRPKTGPDLVSPETRMTINRSDYRAFLRQVEVALESALDESAAAVDAAPQRDQLETMHGEVVRTRRALEAKMSGSGSGVAAE